MPRPAECSGPSLMENCRHPIVDIPKFIAFVTVMVGVLQVKENGVDIDSHGIEAGLQGRRGPRDFRRCCRARPVPRRNRRNEDCGCSVPAARPQETDPAVIAITTTTIVVVVHIAVVSL